MKEYIDISKIDKNDIFIDNMNVIIKCYCSFDMYDKIYAMTEDILEDIKRIAKNKFDANKAALLMNELHPGKNLPVPDPWYGTEPGYHEVYALMNDACERIIEKYKGSPTPPKEGHRTTIS